jgi:poly(3-hydroxybutyrate) depolymerase
MGEWDAGCSFTREDHVFKSRRKKCAAWLYRPVGAVRPPVVVMAHGFGAQRDFGRREVRGQGHGRLPLRLPQFRGQ